VYEDINLRYAFLRKVDFTRAIISTQSADRSEIDLRETDLQGCRLWDVDLRGVRLNKANLRGAWLINTQLQGADLKGADLRGAILVGVTFSTKTNLESADIRGIQCLTMDQLNSSVTRKKSQRGVFSSAKSTGLQTDWRGINLEGENGVSVTAGETDDWFLERATRKKTKIANLSPAETIALQKELGLDKEHDDRHEEVFGGDGSDNDDGQ